MDAYAVVSEWEKGRGERTGYLQANEWAGSSWTKWEKKGITAGQEKEDLQKEVIG